MRPFRALVVIGVVGALALGACGSAHPTSSASAVTHLTVLARHHHDPTAFTEGLVFGSRDRLYESSGQYGSSQLRQVDPETGRVVWHTDLAAGYFGEGLGIDRGVLVQLTWKEHVALTASAATLRPRSRTFAIAGEGWGLSFDLRRHRWVQSDGSDTLTFRDASTFAVTGTLRVTRDGAPIDQLNELEVVGRDVWANVWHSDDLERIDLATGHVVQSVDLTSLVPRGITNPDFVLNGVAHRPGDPPTRLWVTGKRWPTMYEIQVPS